MADYLTVPGTAKNPSALKKFKIEEVAKVSTSHQSPGADQGCQAILDQPKRAKSLTASYPTAAQQG